MNARDRINQITATVRDAKAMPMSTSCLVNRAEMLDRLERLRDDLSANRDHADALLSDRETVLSATRDQAERILEIARREREDLIEQTDVLAAARARAAAVTSESQAESIRLLADADDYVDRKLAEFETLLSQLASQVNNGRRHLTARREVDLAQFEKSSQFEKRSEEEAPVDSGRDRGRERLDVLAKQKSLTAHLDEYPAFG
jgi:cell division septum initiation protein DivIVA